MDQDNQTLDRRRRQLIKALAAGLFVAGSERALAAGIFGQLPQPLPSGRSFYRLEGDVRVNGETATPTTPVVTGDEIKTASNAEAIFVVGRDAFLLRGNSSLTLQGRESSVVELLRVISGRLLSVFGRSRHQIETPIATIGIRGTGVYIEGDEQGSYLCTCYGTTTISALGSQEVVEQITSRHHDAPRRIERRQDGSLQLKSAPVRDHTDLELMILEALTGRSPPFEVAGSGGYDSPRRRY